MPIIKLKGESRLSISKIKIEVFYEFNPELQTTDTFRLRKQRELEEKVQNLMLEYFDDSEIVEH